MVASNGQQFGGPGCEPGFTLLFRFKSGLVPLNYRASREALKRIMCLATFNTDKLISFSVDSKISVDWEIYLFFHKLSTPPSMSTKLILSLSLSHILTLSRILTLSHILSQHQPFQSLKTCLFILLPPASQCV